MSISVFCLHMYQTHSLVHIRTSTLLHTLLRFVFVFFKNKQNNTDADNVAQLEAVHLAYQRPGVSCLTLNKA